MDNLCHTLVGAAFGEAGLKRRTRYGSATLMIAANLPDLDVLVFATSAPSVAFRRGWTHGLAAQALLPLALTALVLLFARRRAPARHGPPVSAPWLLLLAYIGVLSHVYLDLLNNYGVRLLAPFDWHWFYGDAVFIIDPWLWLALGLGVWRSRPGTQASSHTKTWPARTALVMAVIYIAAMCVSARLARGRVIDVWQTARGRGPAAVMVGPVPVNPFRRAIVVDAGDHYETGTFAWFPPRVAFDPEIVAKNGDDPRVAYARTAPHIRGFLVWSRFPFWSIEPARDGHRVSVSDMRFASRGGMFVQSVIVPAASP